MSKTCHFCIKLNIKLIQDQCQRRSSKIEKLCLLSTILNDSDLSGAEIFECHLNVIS